MKKLVKKLVISNIRYPIFIAIFFLISNFLISSVALAAPNINSMTGNIATQSGYGPATATTLSETIGSLIKIVLSFIGVIFLVLTIYAGILWMTAAGNEENVTKATKILTFSVTGLIIILAAYSITWFVVGALTGATAPSTVGGASTGRDPRCDNWFTALINPSLCP